MLRSSGFRNCGMMNSRTVSGNPSLRLGRVSSRRDRSVFAPCRAVPIGRDNQPQPDVPKDRQQRRGGDWLQRLLNRFGPLADRSKTTLVLDFEKPLINLDNRIKEVIIIFCFTNLAFLD